jgi:hypothetical protein
MHARETHVCQSRQICRIDGPGHLGWDETLPVLGVRPLLSQILFALVVGECRSHHDRYPEDVEPLAHHGLKVISGPQANRWLQRMLTSMIEATGHV